LILPKNLIYQFVNPWDLFHLLIQLKMFWCRINWLLGILEKRLKMTGFFFNFWGFFDTLTFDSW